MKDEVFIKCMENSLWAQYIIEYFKFVGFSVSKDAYGDIASTEKMRRVTSADFASNQINIIIRRSGRYKNKVIRKQIGNNISVISVYVQEQKFSDVAIRNTIIGNLADIVTSENFEERKSLKYLSEEYEEHNLFYHLYNEGLLKYAEDYYNGSGEQNGLKETIRAACGASKKDLAQCFSDLKGNEAIYYTDKYYRYVVLLLKYKLNDLKNSIEDSYIFSPSKLLDEIDSLSRIYPHFVRVFYLAARICRTDFQLNYRFISYINRAFEAANEGGYSDKTKAFLYYQLAKFYEEHNYSVEIIKAAYTKAQKIDTDNYFVLYKQAEYLYKAGEVENAVIILKNIENQLVDHFNSFVKMMPKRRIHGYKCCAFLGNIDLNQRQYDSAEMYYMKSIDLAIEDCLYFKENDKEDPWKKIFYMCMSLTPITSNRMRIYRTRQETYRKAEELRIRLYSGLESDLREYWKKEQ